MALSLVWARVQSGATVYSNLESKLTDMYGMAITKDGAHLCILYQLEWYSLKRRIKLSENETGILLTSPRYLATRAKPHCVLLR